MKITILVDNINSWIMPYAKKIVKDLNNQHKIKLIHNQNKITFGDCVFFLSCEKIVKLEILKKNRHNLVVHESWLPKGKGWSPLTWQILEGKNKIPLTLFEAVDKVDDGDIYLQEEIKFKGNELIDELHQAQGEKTIELIKKFVNNYSKLKRKKQVGRESFYSKRIPKDSELDIKKSIKQQFNLLRVCDNKKYPAFFNFKGHRYILKISKDKN